MKTITIPDCMHPAFELILNGIPYRYPAGQTVTVPDEIAALIAAHSEHHDAKYPGQEVQPPFRSDNIAEAPVLDAATEQTKVLVVENGTTMQLPASSLGGGGTTIHFSDWLDVGCEIYPEDGYNVGDLILRTDTNIIYEITGFDPNPDVDPTLPYLHLEEKYRIASAYGSNGYEFPEDSDAPKANQRVYFRGEFSESMLSGYGPMLVTYHGALYFTDGNYYEGGNPEEYPGWIPVSSNTLYLTYSQVEQDEPGAWSHTYDAVYQALIAEKKALVFRCSDFDEDWYTNMWKMETDGTFVFGGNTTAEYKLSPN